MGEPMENCQEMIDKDFKFDDDIEAELQHIAVEEDQHDIAPVPDICEKLSNNDFNLELKESVEKEKVKEEKAAIKIAYSHVKTPDEVDDLPEHEVAPHDDVTYDDNLTSNREADNRDIEELEDNANDKEKEKDRTEKEKKEERERKDKERSEKEREEKERKEKLKKEKKEREKEKAD